LYLAFVCQLLAPCFQLLGHGLVREGVAARENPAGLLADIVAFALAFVLIFPQTFVLAFCASFLASVSCLLLASLSYLKLQAARSG
jgi:hypothetical protein